MKERKLNTNSIPNEALIKEYQMLFYQMMDYKGSRSYVIEQLKHFKELLSDLSTPKVVKPYWKEKAQKTESEISEFFRNTFKSEYLYKQFTEEIPSKVKNEHDLKLNKELSGPNFNLGHLFIILFESPIVFLNVLIAQRNFIATVIECFEISGLLELEIQKRNSFWFSRYHVLFTINPKGTRKENLKAFFLTKTETEEIFNNLKNKGHAIINGKLIHLDTFLEVRVSRSLIQKEEDGLYRLKYSIRNDEEFIKSFQDVTAEFYNNKFLSTLNPTLNLKNKTEPTMKNQNFDTPTKEVKALISAGKIKTALNELINLTTKTQDKDLQNELLLLSAQFNKEEENINLGINKNKEERNRVILSLLKFTDQIDEVFANKQTVRSDKKPLIKVVGHKSTGFCIRTGTPIPFNPEKPLSYDAYKTWSQFGDPNYPEKFCHFSGEPSNGETSVSRPILKKNWQKAKEVHGF